MLGYLDIDGAPVIGRIPILDVSPVLDHGTAKAATGETIPVSATVIREGHDALGAGVVLYDPRGRRRPLRTMSLLAPAPTATAPRSPWTTRAAGASSWRRGATPWPPGATTRASRSRWARTSTSCWRRVPGCSSARPGACPAARPWPASPPRCATTPCPPPPAWRSPRAPRSPPNSRPTRCASWSPAPSGSRWWCTAAARCTAPGTSSSRAPRAPPRRAPTAPGARAPSPPPPSACRPSPTWASTSSTCRPSTRWAGPSARAPTTPWRPGPATPDRCGPSAPPRAATTPSTPTSARWRTSTTSSRRPARTAWRSHSISRSSVHPTIRG